MDGSTFRAADALVCVLSAEPVSVMMLQCASADVFGWGCGQAVLWVLVHSRVTLYDADVLHFALYSPLSPNPGVRGRVVLVMSVMDSTVTARFLSGHPPGGGGPLLFRPRQAFVE